ncbi:unnamed protein product, partial [Hapterophycus canaliculatus]
MSRFLEGLDPTAHPFVQRLTSTQMFWVTVQQWIGRPSARRLLFFEECALAIKNRRAGAVVPWRDSGGDASVGESSAGGRGREGWTHGGFIPLVDEVRLKRPDLYGLSSYNLYGSARLEGSRSTPLATPPARQRRRSSPWEEIYGDPVAFPTEAGLIITTEAVVAAGDAQKEETVDGPGDDDDGGADDSVCQVCTGPPIIIPGPTAEGLREGRDQPSFGYDDGWPTPLNRGLLRTPPEALPPVVLKLQQHASLHSSHQQRRPQRRRQQQQQRLAATAVEGESKSTCTPADAAAAVAAAVVGSTSSLSPSSRGSTTLGVLRVASPKAPLSQQQPRRWSLGGPPVQAEEGSGQPPQETPGYRGEERLWRPHGKGRMVYGDFTV